MSERATPARHQRSARTRAVPAHRGLHHGREARDFHGIEALAEHAGDSFHRGVVLYAGEHAVAFGPRRHALPLPALWELGSTPQPDEPLA